MNPIKLIVALCVLSAFPGLSAHGKAAEQKRQPDREPEAEIKKLQQERIAMLSEAAEYMLQRYREGRIDFGPFVLAQADLVKAKLDATEKPDERILLLEEQLRLASAALEFAQRRFEAGATTKVDVLQARANVLDIKIRLLRSQARAKATTE